VCAMLVDRPMDIEFYGRIVNLISELLFCGRHYSANACLTPLCSLHGLAVTTIEALGNTKTKLHQIQVCTTTNTLVVAAICAAFIIRKLEYTWTCSTLAEGRRGYLFLQDL